MLCVLYYNEKCLKATKTTFRFFISVEVSSDCVLISCNYLDSLEWSLPTLFSFVGGSFALTVCSSGMWRRQRQATPELLPRKSHGWRSLVGCSPWGRESDATELLHFHFHFPALEKEMATHSSVLAWRIPGTTEPAGLPSTVSHRVRHDWSDLAAAAAAGKESKSTRGWMCRDKYRGEE